MPDTLDAWEARCRAHGLSITASRRAILAALLQSDVPADAVEWLLAAQRHHPATSVGTVYRFLRELERHGLVEVLAQSHSRCRWRLKSLASTASSNGLKAMLEPLQVFLREMETLGLAEARSDVPDIGHAAPKSVTPTWWLLQQIAESLGYRLAPRPSNPVY
jgi:hypothetical protein